MFYDENLWDIATDTLKGKCIAKMPLLKKNSQKLKQIQGQPLWAQIEESCVQYQLVLIVVF